MGNLGQHCATFIAVYFASLLVAVPASSKLRYFQDKEFKDLKSADESFAIFLHHKDALDTDAKNAINAINSSSSGLRQELVVGLIDCSASRINPCEKSENIDRLLFYNYLLLENPFMLHDKNDYDEVQKLFAGRADVFVFYVPSLGTKGFKEYVRPSCYLLPFPGSMIFASPSMYCDAMLDWVNSSLSNSHNLKLHLDNAGDSSDCDTEIEHLMAVERSVDIPREVAICLTTNEELRDNGKSAWYLSCSLSAEGDRCSTKFATSDLNEHAFDKMLSQPSPVTVFTAGIFEVTVQKLVNSGSDVLVLVAGDGKFEKALKLANDFVADMGMGVRCLVVNSARMSDNVKYLSSRIEDGKIFISASPGKQGEPALVDVGFMKEETLEEVTGAFHLAMDDPFAKAKRLETAQETGDIEDDPYILSPSETQDDPMAFSVHNTEHVRNLYYYDFKTIPRLTDKTYAEVTESDTYSVILFTLEFNARALAALVNYVEIHKAYKENGDSPLYRLECYNWPDVCQKAGVFTHPRMFFYPAGSQKATEYEGLWEKKSMEEAIKRYRMPSVIVVRQQEDILDYLPLSGRMIVGFFESDEGTDVFRNAAEDAGREYQFIEVHEVTAQFVAKQYQIHFEHRGLQAFDKGFPVGEQIKFQTKSDIVEFMEDVFAPSSFEELTISNFAKMVKDPKPMVIYFRSDNDAESAQVLNRTIQIISPDEKYSNKVLFTWMDASANSTGEFVLNAYNVKSGLLSPVVAFFDKKGSVMLRSCFSEDCEEESLTNWLDFCLEGKVAASYTLSNEDWKPRLAGYDFLELMRADGIYPTEKSSSDQGDDDGSSAMSGRGRTVAARHEKPKKEMEGDVTAEQQQPPKSSNGEKPGHTEL